MPTKKQEQKLNKIKEQSEKFVNQMSLKINELCEISNYKDSSNISHTIDRLKLYLRELNEFQFQN